MSAQGASAARGTAGAPTASGSASALEPAAPASEFIEAARYLPQGAVGVWQQSGAVIRSNAANLAQLIDGAAVSYEQYGVRSYAKTEYRKPGTHLVALVEVYVFEAPLGAFGRYSLNLSDGRDPASLRTQSVSIGAGAFQGSTQLTFWKGAQLVQVSVSDDSDEPDEAAMNAAAREALPTIANAVATLLPDGAAPSAPLPSAGLVWGGGTYRADGVLGVDQSGPGWVGFYARGDGAAARRYRLAILDRADDGAARQTVARYRRGAVTPVAGLADEAFESRDGDQVRLVARRGTRVYIVSDAGASGLTALEPASFRDVLRDALGASPTAAPTAR